METFSALLAPLWGGSPHKGQWRGTLKFSLIGSWTNGWANNRGAGELGRHRTILWRHWNVTNWPTVGPSVRRSIRRSIRPRGFIMGRHWRNGLKFGVLIHPDHFRNSFDFGHSLRWDKFRVCNYYLGNDWQPKLCVYVSLLLLYGLRYNVTFHQLSFLLIFIEIQLSFNEKTTWKDTQL